MTFLCRLFGHKPKPPGWWGDIPYMEIKRDATDNIGRIHGEAFHECDRCGERYRVGRLHLNNPVIKNALGVSTSSGSRTGGENG